MRGTFGSTPRVGRRPVRRSVNRVVQSVVEMLETRQLLSTVTGFTNFTLNRAATNPVTVPAISTDSSTLTLTTASNNQTSSAIYNSPVYYQNFTAEFTYTALKGSTASKADGITFMLENPSPLSPFPVSGVGALGSGGANLGYGGISSSFSLQLNVYQGSSTAVSNNGVVQSPPYTNTGSVNLASGDPINVSLTYNSTSNTLIESLTDSTTNATFATTYNNVDLWADVGFKPTAYVGFTGATGVLNALQTISNFTFTTNTSVPPAPPVPPIPPPPPPPVNTVSNFANFALNGANSLQVDGSAPQDNNDGLAPTVSSDNNTLTLTTAAADQASSAFFDSPVGYQNFTASFTYTKTPNSNGTTKPANGISFTLQDDPRGANALGGGGGDMGYGTDTSHSAEPISPSFAAEFNIMNVSSIGVSTDGAPTLSTTNGNTGNVNLASGDPIKVKLSYNSVTQSLTETLSDSVANTTYSATFNNINLVNSLGKATAVVGFTGGTGGSDARQTISNFTYSASPIGLPPATSATGFGQFNLNAANGAGIDGSSPTDNNPSGVPAVSSDNNTLTLTSNAANEASSGFSDAALYYNNFSANFTYTVVGGYPDNGPAGFTFTLEDDPRGQTGLGAGGANLGAGSDGSSTQITPALSIEFGFRGITVNGVTEGIAGNPTIAPINFNIIYSAQNDELFVTTTQHTPPTGVSVADDSFNISLAQTLDSPTAYVGFTGGTTSGIVQTISNFSYSGSPAPQVNLGGYAETYGIQTDGTADLDNGYDGAGNALSYTFFGSPTGPSAQTYTSLSPAQTFYFLPPDAPDVVTAMGQTIAVPEGNYGTLSLLGDAVNGTQPNQTIQLNYTNGASTTVIQSFSDWFTPQNYPNEKAAMTMNYNLSSSGAQENAGSTIDLYEYSISVNPNLTLQSITLPIDKDVKILAMNVNAAAAVASISPTNGPTDGGTTVTINGTGLIGTTAVDFGSTPSPSFTLSSVNGRIVITAIAPPESGGTVDVTVVGPYGTSQTTSADQFTYVAQTPIAITSVVVNGNNASLAGAQRSMVNSIEYTFNQPVKLAANAFGIAVHPGQTGTVPSLTWGMPNPDANDDDTQWVVQFYGKGIPGGTVGSIANGVYDITLNGSAVTNEYYPEQTGTSQTDTFYRLFGDINGDGAVNAADNVQFKTAMATYNAAFDYNGDGVVNAADNLQFKRDLSISYAGFTPTI